MECIREYLDDLDTLRECIPRREYLIPRRVLMAELNGGRVRSRPRICWMDGVKVILGRILLVF